MFKRMDEATILLTLTRKKHALYATVRTVPPLTHAPRAIVARERIYVVMIMRRRVAKQLTGTVAKKMLDVPLLAAAQMELVIQNVGVTIRVAANASVFVSSGVAIVVIVDGSS